MAIYGYVQTLETAEGPKAEFARCVLNGDKIQLSQSDIEDRVNELNSFLNSGEATEAMFAEHQGNEYKTALSALKKKRPALL